MTSWIDWFSPRTEDTRMILAERGGGLPPRSALTGGRLGVAGPPVTPWGRGRHLGQKAGGLTLPAAQPSVGLVLPGQIFQRAAALALPEERHQEAGHQRARDRDEDDEVLQVNPLPLGNCS